MALLMECMCLECGISSFHEMESISLEEAGGGVRVVNNKYCPECGGMLRLIGKAGDEPNYRLD